MQKILSIFSVLLLTMVFYSCHTPSAFVSKSMSKQSKPLKNYVILYSVLSEDLQDVGEKNYDSHLKGKFNNLEDKFFRDNMVDKYISTAEMGTVWDYRRLFDDFKAYNFQEFEEILNKNDIEFILLVTQKRFIPREQLGDLRNHQVYLFERGKKEPVWIAYGYPGSTPRRLAIGVHKDLRKEGIL